VVILGRFIIDTERVSVFASGVDTSASLTLVEAKMRVLTEGADERRETGGDGALDESLGVVGGGLKSILLSGIVDVAAGSPLLVLSELKVLLCTLGLKRGPVAIKGGFEHGLQKDKSGGSNLDVTGMRKGTTMKEVSVLDLKKRVRKIEKVGKEVTLAVEASPFFVNCWIFWVSFDMEVKS
jgi:hypothetical protein